MYLTYRQENRAFADVGLWQQSSATLTDRGQSERLNVLRVTDGTLQALGVQPMRGRWFVEEEHPHRRGAETQRRSARESGVRALL
jgi:hypothetical protein